jgi:MFS family permease
MGIGNLLAMPFALTIGRRPVFLLTCLIMIAGGIWCQVSKDLTSHIAGRAVMALAAGQSEALAPLIVQEVYFLHERARQLSWFIFIENTTVAVMFIASTYMTTAWGWRWWYVAVAWLTLLRDAR